MPKASEFVKILHLHAADSAEWQSYTLLLKKIIRLNSVLHYLSPVKKIAAIALLVLLLFNWIGYRTVADWLQARAESKLQAVIEEGNYNPVQLVEFSVVTNLPYTNDWLDWERCNGTIEVNGYHYQYVERKLEKGKMLYHCLPNSEKQSVVAARDEFFQLVNSFNQQNNQKPVSKSVAISNFIGDYDDAVSLYSGYHPVFITLSNQWYDTKSLLVNSERLRPEQPPELALS